jgi:mRNA interferase RelE/StbE
MEVKATKTFIKQLKKTPEHIQKDVQAVIKNLNKVQSLREINHCKKLQGYNKYYRIRIANYRMGIEELKPAVLLICILEHSQIYKVFPPQ